jgi:hypothetical protein
MRLRTIVVIFASLLVAVFVAINWSAFVMPTTLSLAFTSVEAPLGIVMLGILVLFALAGRLHGALAKRPSTSAGTGELHEQQRWPISRGARFAELRGVVHAETERLATQLVMNRGYREEVREQSPRSRRRGRADDRCADGSRELIRDDGRPAYQHPRWC